MRKMNKSLIILAIIAGVLIFGNSINSSSQGDGKLIDVTGGTAMGNVEASYTPNSYTLIAVMTGLPSLEPGK